MNYVALINVKNTMNNLIKRLEEKKQKLDVLRPLPPAFLQSLDHWFIIELSYNPNAIDGNGRTARLLMNLLLIRTGYPPAVIENAKRSAYIDAIEKSQKTNDLSDFYTFIFNAINKSFDKYLEAAAQVIE